MVNSSLCPSIAKGWCAFLHLHHHSLPDS